MKERITNIAGVVLAGGKCKRMGGVDKAFIEIQGTPIIQRTVNVLKGIFDELILVSNSPEKYDSYRNDCVVVSDVIPDKGPLGGIHTAMSTTEKEAVFVTACDMPFLNDAFIEIESYYFNSFKPDALIPRKKSKIEPLCAIYDTQLEARVKSFLENGSDRSVTGFLNTVETKYLELDDSRFHQIVFRNVNTDEDVRSINSVLSSDSNAFELNDYNSISHQAQYFTEIDSDTGQEN